ncbi:small terminase subunit [Escherichia coli]|nr:small terminase subunit [Escherichia coli]
MSLSPARQHRLRVQAEQAAREGGSVRHASGYDLMLLQLAEDRRRLKGVQSTVKKAEIKVELLPKYAAWAEGVLTAGGAQQDDVLMYVMLWRIDAGDYAGALEIGRHALRHGWVMPLGNRNVQTVLAEEMADAAQSAMLAATGFDADLLLQTLELTDGIWSVRCSAQSDRSCGYCTGRRGAGCLEILATHHRISRWRGGRIQSGGRSHQCCIRTT